MIDRVIFYADIHFEDWSWRNSVEKGIGASETSMVEMAWRLARRGYQVTCYAPVPEEDDGKFWRDTEWRHYKHADFTEKGLWVLYRNPAVLDKFGDLDPEQPRWLMAQDVWYPTFNKERVAKLDKVLSLCAEHTRHLVGMSPEIDGKIWRTSNGVKVDLMREVLAEGAPERNPKKLIYASSPDRGLVVLLDIFRRARNLVEDLELHVFYGFDNIDKIIAGNLAWGERFRGLKEEIQGLITQPGVHWRGRVPQHVLYREHLSSGIWCYPTDFTETSCVTAMEAQALGAIPITRPLWALADNVHHGAVIEGSPEHDPLARARYVGEIFRLASNPALQERVRASMMETSRAVFNWERLVDQWEAALLRSDYTVPRLDYAQFSFQHKFAAGRTLNVGCDTDFSRLKQREDLHVLNLDVVEISPMSKQPNKYDVLHDARLPYPASFGTFETVILGDILEHCTEEDTVKILVNALTVLRPGGRLLITCPDDGERSIKEQQPEMSDGMEFAPGVLAYHSRRISRGDLERLIGEAIRVSEVPAAIAVYQEIDYTQFLGHAFLVARAKASEVTL